jgi:Mg2+/citrate symporter
MSPDRIIQAVNTILRRDNHPFRLAFQNESFYFAVIPLVPNL